jgi:hypothetical protein
MFFFNSKYVFFFLEAKQKTSKNRHGESFSRRHVSVALLARAAAKPETRSEGQVLSQTVPPQAQRVQNMHACMVMTVLWIGQCGPPRCQRRTPRQGCRRARDPVRGPGAVSVGLCAETVHACLCGDG